MADSATVAAAAAEHGSGGLPQFDLSWWPGQMVWMLLIFGVMFFLFAKVFVPRIGGTIDAREGKIAGDIADARRLKAEAEAQAAAGAAEMAEARARAQKLATDAKDKSAAEAATRQAAEEAKLADRLAVAEAEIRSARDQAMTNVQSIAVETAQAIVERLTGVAASAADVDAALAAPGA